MAVATFPTPARARTKESTLEELEVQGAEVAYADGLAALDAAKRVLASRRPTAEAAMHLVTIGLAREIQEILDSDRSAAANPDRVKNAARAAIRPARALTGDILADLVLVGMEGAPKPLLRFELADWHYFANKSRGEVDGATRRFDAASLAVQLLDQEAKTVTTDLSDKAKDKLRSALAEAWR